MRLEIVVGIEIGILDSQSLGSGFFLYELFEKESVTIQDSNFHSDDHFESHLFGNGLYWRRHSGDRKYFLVTGTLNPNTNLGN